MKRFNVIKYPAVTKDRDVTLRWIRAYCDIVIEVNKLNDIVEDLGVISNIPIANIINICINQLRSSGLNNEQIIDFITINLESSLD
jgi:hypothetical protein